MAGQLGLGTCVARWQSAPKASRELWLVRWPTISDGQRTLPANWERLEIQFPEARIIGHDLVKDQLPHLVPVIPAQRSILLNTDRRSAESLRCCIWYAAI